MRLQMRLQDEERREAWEEAAADDMPLTDTERADQATAGPRQGLVLTPPPGDAVDDDDDDRLSSTTDSSDVRAIPPPSADVRWECGQCGRATTVDQPFCSSIACSAPRPPPGPHWRMRAGQPMWPCPLCASLNPAWRPQCNHPGCARDRPVDYRRWETLPEDANPSRAPRSAAQSGSLHDMMERWACFYPTGPPAFGPQGDIVGFDPPQGVQSDGHVEARPSALDHVDATWLVWSLRDHDIPPGGGGSARVGISCSRCATLTCREARTAGLATPRGTCRRASCLNPAIS